MNAIPERAFRLLQARNQQCYVTQETLVWPFTGHATIAVADAIAGLRECIEQIEEHRERIAHPPPVEERTWGEKRDSSA